MESGPVEAVLREPKTPTRSHFSRPRPRVLALRAALACDIPWRAARDPLKIASAALSPADARSPSMSAGRRRRPRSHSARTASRAVIAPAKWGSPDERTAALGGLFSGQDLSPGGIFGHFFAERGARPALASDELLRCRGPLVRHRRRIRFREIGIRRASRCILDRPDFPAWCRLEGHSLFDLRRRELRCARIYKIDAFRTLTVRSTRASNRERYPLSRWRPWAKTKQSRAALARSSVARRRSASRLRTPRSTA